MVSSTKLTSLLFMKIFVFIFFSGEKMRIDLRTSFTGETESQELRHTNLLILDEIFDSSLDTSVQKTSWRLLGLLSDANTFVISHKARFLQDKFADTIQFEKVKNSEKEGDSELSVHSPWGTSLGVLYYVHTQRGPMSVDLEVKGHPAKLSWQWTWSLSTVTLRPLSLTARSVCWLPIGNVLQPSVWPAGCPRGWSWLYTQRRLEEKQCLCSFWMSLRTPVSRNWWSVSLVVSQDLARLQYLAEEDFFYWWWRRWWDEPCWPCQSLFQDW